MTATVTDATVSPAASQRRFSRKLIALVATVVVLVAGAVITAVAVSFHYLHATSLQCVCAIGWGSDEHAHAVDGLLENGMAVDNTPSHRHTYWIDVQNRSAVTQTILGVADEGVPETVSVGSAGLGMQTPDTMRFVPPPVALRPGEDRYLRVGLDVCAPRGGEAVFTSLDLRVRVGAFIRTERVSFDNFALGVVGKHVGCG